jgi:TPR repeat protein
LKTQTPFLALIVLVMAAALKLPAQTGTTQRTYKNIFDSIPTNDFGFVPDATNMASQTQMFHAPASDIIIQVSRETRAKAERGDTEAQFALAVSYYSATNYTEAATWYQKSAENGFAEAQTQIGLCYLYGNGVSLDTERAVKWFRKSAERGDKSGQAMLGACFGSGIGVPKNEVEAYKWLSLAAAHSWQDSSLGGAYQASLTYIYTNILSCMKICETNMSREEIVEAERLAAVFVPQKESLASKPNPEDLTTKFSPTASGTGFFVTDDGFLVTCAHVVKGATQIRVSTSAGLIDAKIASVDTANDLALLKAETIPQGGAALPIAASRTVNLGSTVATVGFPDPTLQGFAPKLAKGEIASLSGVADDPRYFQISVPVQPGNSGGALVDEHGNVVGIVSAKLNAQAALAASGALPENVNYAVKSSFLLSFLESMPDAKLKTAITNNLNFADVVKSAQKATVLVLVVAAPEPQVIISAPPAPQRRQVSYKSIYGGVNSSQTIDSVLDDGNLIKLNDGSLWQVSPYDAADSGVWTSATEITVIDGNDPNYPYKLVNTDDNETVNAKLIRE